jgi:hypothetical protein
VVVLNRSPNFKHKVWVFAAHLAHRGGGCEGEVLAELRQANLRTAISPACCAMEAFTHPARPLPRPDRLR